MNVFYIALSAFLGGIVAAVLGWLDSGETFDPKKFASSVLRALLAAVVFAIAYNYADNISGADIGIAFLGGAGVDSLGNRISGSIKSGVKLG